jgi:FAD/FMN-containing dehydrogenase
MKQGYQSWGRYFKAVHQVVNIAWRNDRLPMENLAERKLLPYGNGRSYGDVCLNNGGTLVDVKSLNHFIRFCPDSGVLCCEAGILFSEILEHVVPKGWFLPVTPGTQFVTLGGAIANDVHGKNHHRAGSFGCHVRCFELLRSDGARLLCSPDQNREWYCATIGGLGLTGLITWAEIQLKRISGPYIRQESIRYSNLEEFFELSSESDQDYEYTVAWVDCLAKNKNLGRGIFFRGNHSEETIGEIPWAAKLNLTIPLDPPVSLINHWSLKLFNEVYYRKHKKNSISVIHYVPFFYPLDAILEWNKIYGPRGFLQYQCVIPRAHGKEIIKDILTCISKAEVGSFLAVIKIFGNKPSPGLLSFPRPGITLALDFPNQGSTTLGLLNELDALTCEAGGAVYPAKDSRMSGRSFRRYFDQWERFTPFMDKRFSSGFWRRVSEVHP